MTEQGRAPEPEAPAGAHVAPLPADHVAAASCWCSPIRSSIPGVVGFIYVHRLAPARGLVR